MTARHERPATSLMAEYWEACRKRGEVRRKVFGVVALKGAQQPKGHVIGWGVMRSYAEMVQQRQPDPDKWEIREFHHEQEPTP